ncbi:MAG TPA: lysophospholipid acyltransferase family protein [Anaerolineae bacterium]|nr:lysophospholipid acyltransferase family protein [Anaerolineae bacterium]
MTEPKKPNRRRSPVRAASAAPVEQKSPNGDGEGKVETALASTEEIGFSPSEPDIEKASPGPNSSLAEAEGQEEVPVEQLQQQLMQELNELTKRLKELSPAFIPTQIPGAQGLLAAAQNILGKANFDKLRSVAGDLLDLDTWKGAWYIANHMLQAQAGTVQRRLRGEYETDEWGMDPEVIDAVIPFFEFLYRKYWRVTTTGLEHVPSSGRALFVVNHSGQLPFDGAMLAAAVKLEHPSNRLIRTMFASWFPTLPFLAPLFVKCGQVLATEDNGVRLLENEELVSVFPEGYKGVGKLYKERYQLARFGRGGFIRMALKTQSPILPVAVVGAEETYISIAKSDALANLLGFPYFPITATFPWLGPLGFIPLPTKWFIDIGAPIPMNEYGPKGDQNLMLVSQLTDQVRGVVQKMINDRLAQRRSVFRG